MLAEVRNRTERFIRRLRVPLCRSPFVVLFRERSDSSHLCSLLDSHSDVFCRFEDFDYREEIRQEETDSKSNATNPTKCRVLHTLNDVVIKHPSRRDSIAHLYDIFSHSVTACGFKFKSPTQLQRYPEIIDELLSLRTRLHVIVLTRENVLKQSVSRQNMLRIQKTLGTHNLFSHLTQEERKQLKSKPCRIDVKYTVDYARQLHDEAQEFQRSVERFDRAANGNSIHIDYDELLVDQDRIVQNTLDFLGVDPNQPCKSYVEKATPNDLRQAVANYDELADAVAGSELEVFLEG